MGVIIKAPSHELQVERVVKSWKKIEKDTIIKSFEICGITFSDPEKSFAYQPVSQLKRLAPFQMKQMKGLNLLLKHHSKTQRTPMMMRL